MSQLKRLLFVTFLLSVILFITKVNSFDPNSVDILTKKTWCNDQLTTCVNICRDSNGGDPTTNFCTPETLNFGCVCKNGVSPNSTEYTQTIPYFTCTADQQACIKKCAPANSPDCVAACSQQKCAATVIKNPGKVPTAVSGSPATPASPTGTGTTTTTPNVNTIFSGSSMIFPIESFTSFTFMLLFTLVFAFILPA